LDLGYIVYMKNLHSYPLREAEQPGKDNRVPFLALVQTYDAPIFYGYWIVGIFPTFHQFASALLEDYYNPGYLVYGDDDAELSHFRDVKQRLCDENNENKNSLIFWSDDLKLTSNALSLRDDTYTSINIENPFKSSERLNFYFQNVREVIEKNPNGNPDSLGYLARSLESNPDLIKYYEQGSSVDDLDDILQLTSWDDKKKRAFTIISKTKGMI